MSKAATADSYSKNMLHQKVFRTIICILFCIIALLPFVLLVMNATRDSESIKAGVSLIPSTHLIENWNIFATDSFICSGSIISTVS